MKQTTFGREVSFTGMGLHTGTKNTVTLRPAPADTGVLFRRVDLDGSPVIPATADRVKRTNRCTMLAEGSACVSTVEHLLAALRGLGVDNAAIDIDGPEAPIADGSSKEFVELIAEAGQVELNSDRKALKVRDPVWVRDGDRLAVALPFDGFKVSCTFTNDHRHPVLGDLFAEFVIDFETFRNELAPARTIGWLSEVESLKERGLALGAEMDMAVVLSEDDVLTPMRFPDEPVRHKILDIVGDLFLAGYIHGHIVTIRSGHEINTRLAQAIVESATVVELT